jgi:hypothetical protein
MSREIASITAAVGAGSDAKRDGMHTRLPPSRRRRLGCKARWRVAGRTRDPAPSGSGIHERDQTLRSQYPKANEQLRAVSGVNSPSPGSIRNHVTFVLEMKAETPPVALAAF